MKILVCEESGVARLYAEVLGRKGHETTSKPTAQDCLEIIDEGNFDAVITGLNIPGDMNGVEFARQLRNDYPEIKVIITTISPESVPANVAHEVLQKPITPLELLVKAVEVK